MVSQGPVRTVCPGCRQGSDPHLPGPRAQARPPGSAPLGPGHCTQDLGRRPHGEGGRGHGAQASGAEAGRGLQAEALEEAGEEQEQLCPGQALPEADTAACGETEAGHQLPAEPGVGGNGGGRRGWESRP